MHWSFGKSSARCDLVFVERAADVIRKVDQIRATWANGDSTDGSVKANNISTGLNQDSVRTITPR